MRNRCENISSIVSYRIGQIRVRAYSTWRLFDTLVNPDILGLSCHRGLSHSLSLSLSLSHARARARETPLAG